MLHFFSPTVLYEKLCEYSVCVGGEPLCAAVAAFIVQGISIVVDRATNNARDVFFRLCLFDFSSPGAREEPDLLAAFLSHPRRGTHQCELY